MTYEWFLVSGFIEDLLRIGKKLQTWKIEGGELILTI